MNSNQNDRFKISLGNMLLIACMFGSVMVTVIGSYYKLSLDFQREISAVMPTMIANTKSIERNSRDITENRTDIKGLSRNK